MAKNGIHGKNGGVKRAGPGRLLKRQQIIGNMTIAHDPKAVGKIVFADTGRDVDLIEDTGPIEKLARISEQVGLRLGNAPKSSESQSDAGTTQKGSLAAMRPWADSDLPINVIIAAERHAYANDRIVSALVSHLLEHVAIGEELKSIAASARRRAADELANIPEAMIDFVNALMACGVVTRDVRYLSRKRMAAIVAAIKDVDPEMILDGIPDMVARATDRGAEYEGYANADRSDDAFAINGGIAEQAQGKEVDGNSRVYGERAETPAEEPPAEGLNTAASEGGLVDVDALDEDADQAVDPIPEPSVEPAATAPMIDAVGGDPVAVPTSAPGRWDVLDLTGLGYRIEEKMAETDDELRAIRYALPEVATVSELAAQGSSEVNLSLGVENQKDRQLAEAFFTRWTRRTSLEMTEEQKRVWIFLLVEIPFRDRGRKLGADGWFDGLLMPGPKGSARVRRIVAEDRSEGALTMALKRPETTPSS